MAVNRSMRLFGIPYQFRDAVDHRSSDLSSSVGTSFLRNIVLEEPIITIIPGRPSYTGGLGDKESFVTALFDAGEGNFDAFKQLVQDSGDEDVRFYDFQRAYTEYMQYVNVMCRAAATFLGLSDEEYAIDGVRLTKYDWRNYRQDSVKYTNLTESAVGAAAEGAKSMFSTALDWGKDALHNIYSYLTGGDSDDSDADEEEPIEYTESSFIYGTYDGESELSSEEIDIAEAIVKDSSFVQFYISNDFQNGDGHSNSTMESKLKSAMLDNGSDIMKEIAFIGNGLGAGGAVEGLTSLGDWVGNQFANLLPESSVTVGFKRVLNLAGNILKGENIVMPEIWQSSDSSRSINFTVHLKSPYGNKFGYFMECLVPLIHLLALCVPKQTTANTYGAPFIVKAYVTGGQSVNLGIVNNIDVTRGNDGKCWSADGLPTEMDVSVGIADLYHDLSMSPQSSPKLFANNSSLVEYLATLCGIDLSQPNAAKKYSNIVNTYTNALTDVPSNIYHGTTEYIDNIISKYIYVGG